MIELALEGMRDVTVIGAPFQKLPEMDRTVYFSRTLNSIPPIDTEDLCNRLGFKFVAMQHNDIDGISELALAHNLELGIISGARILKRQVIETFKQGIVNFHPGMIPETSGLDAFYYTIKNNVDAGITTHLIDPRVDAGQFLAFEPVKVSLTDSPEVVQENTYRAQIIALRSFIQQWKNAALNPEKLNRPQKNEPMEPQEKWEMLLRFPRWRANRFRAQSFEKLRSSCEFGDIESVSRILIEQPDLLEERTAEGWTPLIMAAFHQHVDLVELLLNLGANPNATGRNGTTVLMYAKTALMEKPDAKHDLLNQLIENGADFQRKDMHGLSVLDYVEQAGAKHLIRYFQGKENL
ncbi:ankyrin repeat domain-containing protein [Ruegeria arenilitoris]|uniref:ankyrin repeat domain-containing protein n=1 Tax=Ruegeria arenilitoris TaxID=1173585 RepID=UPI00147A0075|nr:ankyrin repeat domain-containing protein [Ruegeria arenilitoris]